MIPHRIELPLNISYPTVNAYYIPGKFQTLIDCGMNTPETMADLNIALAIHGIGVEDIDRVIITHPHVDHVGLAGTLSGFGAEIWMSDLAAGWMDNLDSARNAALALLLDIMHSHGFDEETTRMTSKFYNGLGPLFSEVPESRRQIFTTGDLVDIGGLNFEVLDARGHSNRQVCFYNQETRQLFSADMLLPKTPVPVVETDLNRPNERQKGLPEMIYSLKKYAGLEIDKVYPGHGNIFSDHRQLALAQLARIENRKQACLEWISRGVRTMPELLEKMYTNLPPRARLGGLAMLVGYIDLLLDEKKIEKKWSDHSFQYIRKK